MSLIHLKLQNFRNFSDLQLEIPAQGMILEGFNGSGKTNFLESIYFLCTARSQRGAKRLDLIKFDSEFCYAEAHFLNMDSLKTVRSVGIGKDKSFVMRIDGIRSNSIIDWFNRRPVISFGPNDLSLIYGTPEDRRRFIDILCSQMYKDYLENLIIYKKALFNRNKILQKNFDEIQVSIYENQMAESGSEIIDKRKDMINFLLPFFIANYTEISQNKECVNLQYQISLKHDYSSKSDCKNVFYELLNQHRNKDRDCGFTSVGPHRDDLVIYINNRLSKNFCSQGQCRSLVLSLKLGSVFCIEKIRNEKMLFLIDDAVSELDSQRTSKVLNLIENKGQLFIAAPEFNRNLLKNFLHLRIEKGEALVS